MRVPRQVPPAAPNGQFGIRMEAMVYDQPVRGVAGPEGLHDQQHANIAYDMIDHHPQPLRVSNSVYLVSSLVLLTISAI